MSDFSDDWSETSEDEIESFHNNYVYIRSPRRIQSPKLCYEEPMDWLPTPETPLFTLCHDLVMHEPSLRSDIVSQIHRLYSATVKCEQMEFGSSFYLLNGDTMELLEKAVNSIKSWCENSTTLDTAWKVLKRIYNYIYLCEEDEEMIEI